MYKISHSDRMPRLVFLNFFKSSFGVLNPTVFILIHLIVPGLWRQLCDEGDLASYGGLT